MVDVLVALADFDRRSGHRRASATRASSTSCSRNCGCPTGHGALPARSQPGSWSGSPRWSSRFGTEGSASRASSSSAKVITQKNREEVLPRFFYRSQPGGEAGGGGDPAGGGGAGEDGASPAVEPVQPLNRSRSGVSAETARAKLEHPVAPAPRTVVEPLTARESRMHVTVSPEFMVLLERGPGGPEPCPSRGDGRAGAHRGAGTAHREAGEAAGHRSCRGEARGAGPRPGQVPVAARFRWGLWLGGTLGDRPRGTAGRGGPSTTSTTAGSFANRTTSRPRARSTATRTWICSLRGIRSCARLCAAYFADGAVGVMRCGDAPSARAARPRRPSPGAPPTAEPAPPARPAAGPPRPPGSRTWRPPRPTRR